MIVAHASHGEADTMALAAALARGLVGGDVVALDGPLGAGKTCFVRGLARGLGLDPGAVSSPTYTLCQEYETDDAPLRLAHVDAYRLGGVEELESIGWEELLAAGDVVVAVEWPTRLEGALPARRILVRFEHLGPDARRLELDVPAGVAERVPALTAVAGPDGCCPGCGRPLPRPAASLPFCSERCRLADLGAWFQERYRFSRAAEADDELG